MHGEPALRRFWDKYTTEDEGKTVKVHRAEHQEHDFAGPWAFGPSAAGPEGSRASGTDVSHVKVEVLRVLSVAEDGTMDYELKVLGIRTADDAKQAYRRLILILHPDKRSLETEVAVGKEVFDIAYRRVKDAHTALTLPSGDSSRPTGGTSAHAAPPPPFRQPPPSSSKARHQQPDQDEAVVGFGKCKGKTFRWVRENEPGYCQWLLAEESSRSSPQLRELARYLRFAGF